VPDPRIELARLRNELGANAIRLYEIPDRDFLVTCSEVGLWVFLTIPWAHHVDFFAHPAAFFHAHKRIRETVAEFRGHPAVAGWFVGNEIQSTLVRWMGPARVKRAIESLIDTGKRTDPEALFSYANYPSTEYLLPGNQDFAAFNIYLEDREKFGCYLRRLQNLAGDKPLIIAEFGLDSKANGEERQAEILDWHLDEVCEAGLAGTTVYAWSDSWARGGQEITGWDFGLVNREGERKAAFDRLASAWKKIGAPADGIDLEQSRPKFSVIVCTYRGVRTLRSCLESLRKLRYPDFEVIIVNDSGDAGVAEIASGFPEFTHIAQEPHGGLSAARNLGAEKSSGDIFAYTDDDCEVHPDWLTWLTVAFSEEGIAAAGGPNLPPPPTSFVQACVEASPGGPSHVLLSDRNAEHVPGCNLAVRREAFFAIGGFDAQFWTAGDDVDFCWRLLKSGYRIGFHPAAMVWHYRRFTICAYLKQQIGYGKAEAMLIPLHPDRFGAMGGARWDGFVYDASQMSAPDVFTRIYQGVFGYAPYQFLYGGGGSTLGYVVSSFQWVALAGGLALVGLLLPLAAAVAVAMLVVTLIHSVRAARRARIDSRYHNWRARICVGVLALVQPLLRSFSRFAGSLPYARLPRGLPPFNKPVFFPRLRRVRWRRHYRFWSETGKTRDDLLPHFLQCCQNSGIATSTGDGWEDWDVELSQSLLYLTRLTTVTEYHDGEKRLTRARLDACPTKVTLMLRGAIILGGLLWWKFGGLEPLSWQTGVLAAALLAPDILRIRLFSRMRHLLRAAAEAEEMKRFS
jgi:glycosyltransferase involved in cell wall biosynthesis